ncbi:MAG: GNAT family N-acetyltransferase [Bacteroidota bacterium]
MPFEVTKGDFSISTAQSKLDVKMIHRFLSEESYWSKHIPLETVQAYIPHSLCFGVYRRDKQVGFARLITDYTTFAYVGDVFILPEQRGKGLGKWLVESMLAHPKMQSLKRWLLFTEDAHGLYSQYGFAALPRVDHALAKINFTTYPAC